MLRHRVTSLANLVVLSLFIQIDVDAHLPNYSIEPTATVEAHTTGDPCVVRMVVSAQCTLNTGNQSGQSHLHQGFVFLQVYYHEPGGSPKVGRGEYKLWPKSGRTHDLFGERRYASPTISLVKTIATGECWHGDATAKGSLWTPPGQNPMKTNALNDFDTVCSPCQARAAQAHREPQNLESEIQYIQHDDNIELALDSEFELARLTNPNIDSAIYFEGRILTLESDPNKVYVFESDDSDYTLTLGYPDGKQTVVLDAFDGAEYQPPAAPPKSTRRILTATWASVKQK